MPRDTASSLRARTHCLVLAGGGGTRLQHITAALGEVREKQFCRFGGPRTLLQQTVDRLLPLTASERISVVVRQDQAEIAGSQLAGFAGPRLLDQPGDRGTGIAVLAALTASPRSVFDGITILSPADHGFADDEAVRSVLTDAVAEAAERHAIVLVGAAADAPRSDFGWIAPAPGHGRLRRVAKFVEKPSLACAERMMAQGAVFNTMLLVAPTSALLASFARVCPTVVGRFICAAMSSGGTRSPLFRRAFHDADSLDFSRDVLGKLPELHFVTLPQSVGWTDLGDGTRLTEWLRTRGADGAATLIRAAAAHRGAHRQPHSSSTPASA